MKPEITNSRRLFIKKPGLRVTRFLFVSSGLAKTIVFLVSPIKIPILHTPKGLCQYVSPKVGLYASFGYYFFGLKLCKSKRVRA